MQLHSSVKCLQSITREEQITKYDISFKSLVTTHWNNKHVNCVTIGNRHRSKNVDANSHKRNICLNIIKIGCHFNTWKWYYYARIEKCMWLLVSWNTNASLMHHARDITSMYNKIINGKWIHRLNHSRRLAIHLFGWLPPTNVCNAFM